MASGLTPSPKAPTAVHAAPDVQDTPYKALFMAPAGTGIGLTVQTVPSQFSENGPLGPPALPTATHDVAAEQETPTRVAPLEPAGLGVDSIVQAVPDHRSASVARPALDWKNPTAVQAVGATQDTPVRLLPIVAPVGFGVGTRDHLLPFHISPKVW